MKSGRKTAGIVAGIAVVAAVAVVGGRAYLRSANLAETLLWIDRSYNPHAGGENSGQGRGWEIHYVTTGGKEEVSRKFRTTLVQNGTCKVAVRSETLEEGIFTEAPSVTTSSFSLADIDPNSIAVKTFDLRGGADCSEEESRCDAAEVYFKTRNSAALIDQAQITTYTKLSGPGREVRRTSQTNEAWLLVNDVAYARRLAQAFKHAVDVCGRL